MQCKNVLAILQYYAEFTYRIASFSHEISIDTIVLVTLFLMSQKINTHIQLVYRTHEIIPSSRRKCRQYRHMYNGTHF